MINLLLLLCTIDASKNVSKYPGEYTIVDDGDLWKYLQRNPGIENTIKQRKFEEISDEEKEHGKCVLFFDWDQTLAPGQKNKMRVLNKGDGEYVSKKLEYFREAFDCDIYILTHGSTWDIIASTPGGSDHWNLGFLVSEHGLGNEYLSGIQKWMITDHQKLEKSQKLTVPINAFISDSFMFGKELEPPLTKFQIMSVLVENIYDNNWTSVFFIDDKMGMHLNYMFDSWSSEKVEEHFYYPNMIWVEDCYPCNIDQSTAKLNEGGKYYYHHLDVLEKLLKENAEEKEDESNESDEEISVVESEY